MFVQYNVYVHYKVNVNLPALCTQWWRTEALVLQAGSLLKCLRMMEETVKEQMNIYLTSDKCD